jgi:hypothetical protein
MAIVSLPTYQGGHPAYPDKVVYASGQRFYGSAPRNLPTRAPVGHYSTKPSYIQKSKEAHESSKAASDASHQANITNDPSHHKTAMDMHRAASVDHIEAGSHPEAGMGRGAYHTEASSYHKKMASMHSEVHP